MTKKTCQGRRFPFTDLLHRVNWLYVTIAVIIPLVAMILTFWVPLRTKTLVFAVIYFFNSILGITAGHHRLWSHRAYQATFFLRCYLAAVGAGAVQGSALLWARQHRAHHRYTDTDKDPYSAHKGIFYSHFGWYLLKQNPKNKVRVDDTDLKNDAVVMWQSRHYAASALAMGYILPILVSSIWGDPLGGLIYGGILRMFVITQAHTTANDFEAISCINSMAHCFGTQPFSDRHTPHDHMFTALLTMGEGYHNFHHEFPCDYRNAVQWYQYDPTKWAIATWRAIGLASHLKTFPSNEIKKGMVQQVQKNLDKSAAKLDWGTPIDQLPIISWELYCARAAAGEQLVAIAGVVYDVGHFLHEHPGGSAILRSVMGKDATAHFNGGLYDHSRAAHNLLSTMRAAILRGGGEVEIWKGEEGKKKEEKGTFLIDLRT